MKLIPLTRGQHAIVDSDDYEWLSQWKWCAQKIERRGKIVGYYALRAVREDDGKQHTTYMHRVVLGLPRGREPLVDHVNKNGLDNRRENLRTADFGQNAANATRRRVDMARGVRFKGGKFEVAIRADGVSRYLGRFDSVEQAQFWYQFHALAAFGEFAMAGGTP